MKEKYSRKKLTDEEYKRRIYDLYGDNISILEPYVNQRYYIDAIFEFSNTHII